jgi:hypothetical protein
MEAASFQMIGFHELGTMHAKCRLIIIIQTYDMNYPER